MLNTVNSFFPRKSPRIGISKKHSFVAVDCKSVMNISWLFVMEVKLFRVQYTVCPGYRKFEKKQITFYWPTKEGKGVNLLPEALCTCIPLFPVSEREGQEGRKRERKIENQLRDQMTTNRSRRSGGPFEPSPCGSQPFFFPVLALSFPSLLFFIHRSPPFHRR